MRVLHLIHCFQTGGLERMVLSLCSALHQDGFVNRVAAYTGEGPIREALAAAGVETTRLPYGGGLDLRLSGHVLSLIKKSRIDLIHTHHVGPFIYGAIPAKIAQIPHVHTEHSRELYGRARMRAIGRSMDLTATVVCVTDEVARWRAQAFGKVPLVIPNGVPMPTASRSSLKPVSRRLLKVPKDAFIIGCVARLSPEKDHATLIQAFGLLVKKGIQAKLILVGGVQNNAYHAQLKGLIGDLGIQDQVLFLGDRSDVDMLLPGFDAIALSSKREGMPLALLEGMAHAMPAVATNVGGIPDLLGNGGGIAVEPGDFRTMSRAFEIYARDANRLKRDSDRAQKIVKKQYSTQIMADGYRRVYEFLLRPVSRNSGEDA